MVIQNFYETFHGGALAAVADAISIACARTVVAEDKEIFLGEQSMSYLSAASENVSIYGLLFLLLSCYFLIGGKIKKRICNWVLLTL